MDVVEGKVAFITGGASGIGLGIAKVLVRAGMKVVLGDIRQDHLDSALEYFAERQQRRNVHGVHLDVTDREGFTAAADEAERTFGKVHVIINNAGVGIEGPLREASFDDWDFGVGVNLGGVINGVMTFVPRIRAHGEGGHVVNTASLAGMVRMPSYMAIYATAKSAVIALSESIQDDLAPDNIGVSVLCPGPIKSNIHQLAQNRPERFKASGAFAQAAERLGHRQVSDLWMEPEQVGEMVLQAIRENRLYVITHGEWADAVTARYDAMMAAMPTERNEDLIASLRSHRTEPAES